MFRGSAQPTGILRRSSIRFLQVRSGISLLAGCLLMLAIAGPAATAKETTDEDWPCFAGPHHDASYREEGLITAWPEGGPEVLWRVPLNPGFGAPTVAGGEVYILDRAVGEADILRCLDLATGKEKWRFRHAAPGKISYPGSRSQPTLDTERIYFVNPFGELFCLSRKTRKKVWNVNILEEYGGRVPNWAVSQSPLLHGKWVIVNPTGSKASVVALSRKSGKEVWTADPIPGKMTYASPMLAKLGGKEQVLALTTEATAGVDAKTGKVLWTHEEWRCRIPITTPTPLPGDRVFLTGGYGAGVSLFAVKKKGPSRFTTETIFSSKESNGQIQQPIFLDEHLYMNGNDKGSGTAWSAWT